MCSYDEGHVSQTVHNDEPLSTREAFRAKSPWFGAMVCPAVMVVDGGRVRMERQRTIFDDEFDRDMEIKRHARQTDPATSHEAAADVVQSGRLSAQCAAILQRLLRGPATSVELSNIACKYTGRISDLRARGHRIVATREDGLWFYSLEESE